MKGRFAHISDLHLGRDAQTDAAVSALCRALIDTDVDQVLLTGDVTHRGRQHEQEAFYRIFAPLVGRLVVVPGNHDRLGDDVSPALMAGGRVLVERRPGLFLVRFDSTAAHNRRLIDSHGELTPRDVGDIERAVSTAPAGLLVILMLHHHVLPLPEDHIGERLASLLRWPNAAELRLGRELVDGLRGKCDLILHGHRHVAGEVTPQQASARPLRVLNAGSTPELGRARIIAHAAGRVTGQEWLRIAEETRGRAAAAEAAAPRAAA